MASNVEEFLKDPSEKALEKCTKEQLLLVAAHYNIELTSSDKKLKESIIKSLKGTLEEKGVLVAKSQDPGFVDSEVKLKELVLREKELDLEVVKCRLEHDRIALKEKELQGELELRKLEGQERERERAFVLKKMELDLAGRNPEGQPPVLPFVAPSESSQRVEQCFDIGKHIKMVPPFSEKEVEKYFSHFERVATSLKWPKDVWTLLLQCVLTGKAQEVYSSLSLEQSAVYDTVKTSILHAYELVPEAYRQRFRNYTKSDRQTFVEFAREKENMFVRWCASKQVETKEQLRDFS